MRTAFVPSGYVSPLLTTGEETIPRTSVGFGAAGWSVGAASGSVRGGIFTARKSETVTQVRVVTGTTAAAATPTLCKIGVYSVAATGDLTLVASTASDTTLFAAASTAYTRSFQASFAKVAGQRYAVAVIVVSGAAIPTFAGLPGVPEGGAAPVLVLRRDGQSDLPSSIVAANNASTAGNILYAVLLP